MVVIILVNIHRARGDGWEGTLSGVPHDGTMQFVDPGRADLDAARVALASSGIMGQGEPGTGPSLGLPEACDNEGEGGMNKCMCTTS